MGFEVDDGSLNYARSAGLYVDGQEAPLFADRIASDPIECGPDTLAILAFGQSNAANSGEGRYVTTGRVQVFNVFDMKYYRAMDPLPGASNDGGSVWGRLADALLAAGMCRAVLLAPIAVGGTFIRDWAPGGRCHPRLMLALRRLKKAGIAPDIVCWHQGESDANLSDMTAAQYRAHFQSIVRALRQAAIDAPVFVAVATLCENANHPHKNRPAIRQGQKAAVSEADGIYPGPDTDAIGTAHRADGCHFNASGLDLHAQAWLAALRAHPSARSARWQKRPSAAMNGANGNRGRDVHAAANSRSLGAGSFMNFLKRLMLKWLWDLGYVLVKRSDHAGGQPASGNPFNAAVRSLGQASNFEFRVDARAEKEFNAIFQRIGGKAALPVLKAHALYMAARHIAKAKVQGDILDCGEGEPAALAMVAATLAALGDTTRRLVLFDITGDPTHGGGTELEPWGGGSDPLDRHSKARRAKTTPLPAPLAAAGYPLELMSVVRFPVGSLDFAKSIAFLTVTPETYQANSAAIGTLIPRLSVGGVIGATSTPASSTQRDAMDEFLDREHPGIQLWQIAGDYRIGVKYGQPGATA